MADGTLLTSEQAADLLGVSNATVLRANRVGSLSSTGTSGDGDPLFSREAIELYRRRRTELFRGAVRSGTPATPAKAAPRAAEPRAERAAGTSDKSADLRPKVEPEVEPEPAEKLPTAAAAAEIAAESPKVDHEVEPESESKSSPAPEPVAREAAPEPGRQQAPAHRPARRHQEPAPTLPEISRQEWLDEWTATVEWLDRLALSLTPIEVAESAPAPRNYETPAHEPAPEPTPAPAAAPGPPEESAASEAVNLAVRPVVSFAILKEIGVALRGRPGVVEARLDRLDGGAAWFVLRHDGSASLDDSVTSALNPLGFSVSRSGHDGFEVVQDAAHTG